MMRATHANHKGWWLGILEVGPKAHAFYVVSPGSDPIVVRGLRDSHDAAITAGRRTLLYEVRNESVPRSHN